MTDHKCDVGISPIFDTVFVAKFSYGIGVLGTPQCPPKASLV